VRRLRTIVLILLVLIFLCGTASADHEIIQDAFGRLQTGEMNPAIDWILDGFPMLCNT
jgi:hypothetical protein